MLITLDGHQPIIQITLPGPPVPGVQQLLGKYSFLAAGFREPEVHLWPFAPLLGVARAGVAVGGRSRPLSELQTALGGGFRLPMRTIFLRNPIGRYMRVSHSITHTSLRT